MMVAGRFTPEFIRHRPGPRFVDIHDGNQFRGWIGRILTCMEAPEIPRPDHGHRNRT
jgi:hypothetical protein